MSEALGSDHSSCFQHSFENSKCIGVNHTDEES